MIPPMLYDRLQSNDTRNTRTSETKLGNPKPKQYPLGYRGGEHWRDKHFQLVYFFLQITRIDAQDTKSLDFLEQDRIEHIRACAHLILHAALQDSD